ncbi:hypothetical protein SAMN05216198_0206 [Halopseudomonas litoralis]|uniref:Uncharacterized protein n=1 Tax=Halopseudomonas litoralis TaxID=797277 RepID=A0A1H1LF02_9GAMM|nr:hypothetical protein [Halopseudomonas litoralis]SDR72635.1 hypothetical protein SAMN05216198_0206 [Halopseudomonas litoralis]
MDWIEVIDSAVKIGLGAAISGIGAFLLTRDAYSREIQKIAHVRRLDSLEQVSEKAEECFSAWRRLASKLGGVYAGRNPPDPDFSERQWKQILVRDREFLETRQSLEHAVARLRLLSAREAATRLAKFNSMVGEFRESLILQRATPSREGFARTRAEVEECIREFHEALSAIYLSADEPAPDKSFKPTPRRGAA